jgi:hypothetical protein
VSIDQALCAGLSDAERRRAHVTGLDFTHAAGLLNLTFARWERGRKEAKRAASASCPYGNGGQPSREGEEGAEISPEEVLSPAVVEELRRSPLLSAAILKVQGGDQQAGGGEDLNVTTRGQLEGLLSTLERGTPKMRARVRELEAELPGGAISVVARKDDDEGERPDLELTTYREGWRNRPAGTRVVCGYVSILQACLVKEGGSYKVLATYMMAD